MSKYDKETVDRLTEKYADVTETMIILQIWEHAILHDIITKMGEFKEFKDVNKDIDESMYFGSVFNDMLERCDELGLTNKAVNQLKELVVLAENVQYIMLRRL
jgi:hypothetical protein